MAVQFNRSSDAKWVQILNDYFVVGTHPAYMAAFFGLIINQEDFHGPLYYDTRPTGRKEQGFWNVKCNPESSPKVNETSQKRLGLKKGSKHESATSRIGGCPVTP